MFNIFIFAKVGHSKLAEMHEDASDFYRFTLVFYTRHRVNIIHLLTGYEGNSKSISVLLY